MGKPTAPAVGSAKFKSKPRASQSNHKTTPGGRTLKKQPNKPRTAGPKPSLPVETPLTPALVKKSKQVNLKQLEKELPKLNTIVPAGVAKPKGKKKGKVFVDDKKTMLRILAVVNEEVEGKERGKIERARNLEIIREAKREEAEKKESVRQCKLEQAKDAVRKQRNNKRRKSTGDVAMKDVEESRPDKSKSGKKRVSFA